MPHSHCMKYEHFPPFTHDILRAQSECPVSRQVGAYVWCVASSFWLSYFLLVFKGYTICVYRPCTLYTHAQSHLQSETEPRSMLMAIGTPRIHV